MLQPSFRDSLKLKEQLVPGHLPLPQCGRRKWMWDRENDELLDTIRMSYSREPRHGSSPVVSNNIRCADIERVKDTHHIGDGVLQQICGHSFRAIGATKAAEVGGNCMEAVRDEERHLFVPEVGRIRPPVQQEDRPATPLVLHMKRNSVNLQH